MITLTGRKLAGRGRVRNEQKHSFGHCEDSKTVSKGKKKQKIQAFLEVESHSNLCTEMQHSFWKNTDNRFMLCT